MGIGAGTETGGTVDRRDRFDDAKFGMFVHWGAYSVGGVEASWPVMLGPELQRRFVEVLHRCGMTEVEMPLKPVELEEYEGYADEFDPRSFDAGSWVDLARDAGQRYLVLTTKHHDGFCLFETATTDYSTAKRAAGRDVVGEVSAACVDGGIGFGAYFSAPDFHDDGYRDRTRPLPGNFLGEPHRPEWDGFLDRMETQVRELCTSYGDLFSWWWDIGFGPQWPLDRFHGLVRELQPGALVNDRLGGLEASVPAALRADFQTPEQTVPRAIPRRSTHVPMDPTMLFALIQRDDWEEAADQVAPLLRAHFEAPADPTVPDPEDFLPWESCLTFGGQWAWSPDLTDLKTGPEVVRDLIEVSSRGGNLLMNVGPRPDGTIQPEFAAALRHVGRWLEANGDGIYGTTYGPVQGRGDLRTTAGRDGTVYVHLLEQPTGAVAVPVAATSATVVADGSPLTVEGGAQGTSIQVGRLRVDDPVTIALR